MLLDSEVEASLAWGEPVNGLRAALVRVSAEGDVKTGRLSAGRVAAGPVQPATKED